MSNNNHDPDTGVSALDGPVHDVDIVSPEKKRGAPRPVIRRLSHTLSEKNLMALTGLFLCLFLLVHLLGNLILPCCRRAE